MDGLPHRVENPVRASAAFGPLADRVLPALWRSDDLADAAVASLEALEPAERPGALERGLNRGPDAEALPEALRAMLADAWTVPTWVDERDCDRAGRLLFRSGMLGGLVLGTKSLVLGYASPAGNKPLVLSGRLTRAEYVSKRLAETAKFVMAVCEPGGLRPGALGHQLTLRVRLMHARVRRLCLASGAWNAAAWGHPINQHDMLATTLVFSAAFMEGLGQLGVQISLQEADRYTQLWNRVGHIIGVEPALLPGSAQEALRSGQLIAETQGAPDDDARQLVKGYFDAPLTAARTPPDRRAAERRVRMGHAVAWHLLGPDLATQLGLRPTRAATLPAWVGRLVRGVERARRKSERLEQTAHDLGRAHWRRAVELGLAGGPADFAMPDRLEGGPFRRAA